MILLKSPLCDVSYRSRKEIHDAAECRFHDLPFATDLLLFAFCLNTVFCILPALGHQENLLLFQDILRIKTVVSSMENANFSQGDLTFS